MALWPTLVRAGISDDTQPQPLDFAAITSPAPLAELIGRTFAPTASNCTSFCSNFDVWVAKTKTQPPFWLHIYKWRGEENWEPFSDQIVNDGIFEASETRLVTSILAEGCARHAMVIDVGGFVGYYALLAGVRGCRVHVWEGHPHNAYLLAQSIIVNGMGKRVTLHNNVCTDEEQPLEFSSVGMDGHVANSYAKNSAENALLAKELQADMKNSFRERHGHMVMPSKIDTVIGPTQEVLLLKIDVEGYEPHALRSAQNLIQSRRVSERLDLRCARVGLCSKQLRPRLNGNASLCPPHSFR
jgi:FkbM family methyltransferase